MNVSFGDINYLAVLLAAVLNFVLGLVWFSPALFGKKYMRALGLREWDMEDRKGVQRIYGAAFISEVISAFVLAILIGAASAHTFLSGAAIGLLVAIAFISAMGDNNYLFEGRASRLFWITAGHHALTFTAMGGLLGAWS